MSAASSPYAQRAAPPEWETARQAREALALSLERSRVRYHQAVGRHGKQFEGAPDVLEPEPPQRHGNNIASVLDLLVRRVRQQDAAWDGERLDPRSDVDGIARQPLRFDDHLTAVHADTNQHVLRGELLLNSYAAWTAASELGNMLMLPSPSRCTIVPPNAS